jgi:carboxypeptidase T
MSPKKPGRALGGILGLVVFIVSVTQAIVALARTPSPGLHPDGAIFPAWFAPQGFANVPERDARWVVRAYYDDRRMLERLASWKEPWMVDQEKGFVVLEVSPEELERLRQDGFRVEIDATLSAGLNQPLTWLPGQTSGIPGYACYRTVEQTFASVQSIVTTYPGLASLSDIGDSWEKLTLGGSDGYDLLVLRLTNEAITGLKPKLFVMTSLHAREYAPPELATRFAEYLVEAYDEDPDITWLLDHNEFHLLLYANPDGRKWAEGGYSWRKNTDNDYCTDSDLRGVDLNRNFAFEWGCCGGSSTDQCSEIYRGPAAASEPETQAIQNYLRAQFADLRADDLSAAAPVTTTGLFLDIHSFGELVLWPWGFTTTPPANGAALETLGRKFAYFNGYTPQPAIGLYPTDGSADDFAYGDLGLAALTFEVGTAFSQDCTTFEQQILPDNLAALIYAAKAARRPYLAPAGPDVTSLTLWPNVVVEGSAVQVTATVDDTRYQTSNGAEPVQNIVAVEYYLDAPPWLSTTLPISGLLAAADGAFDAPVEMVTGTLNTKGLDEGRHLLFVRAQDVDGNWGVVSAGFFNVLPSRIYLPLIYR